MKRTMVAALVLLLAPSALLAQGRQGGGRGMGPGMGAGMNVAKVLIENRADLSLSDDQVVKLQAIADTLEKQNAPMVEEMQRVRAAGGMRDMSDADREKMRASMDRARANSESAQKQIDAVLTADQKSKAQELIERLRPRRGGGRG